MDRINYVDGIQVMMYALGDCRRPLVESATIVEETVFKQMIWFVQRAQTSAESRGDQYLDADNLLLVLHPHQTLLTRVIQKLRVRDDAMRASKSGDNEEPITATGGTEDIDEEGDDEEMKDETASAVAALFSNNGRRMKFCKKVLEEIDPTGLLIETVFAIKVDAGKNGRLRRIAEYAASMDADEYIRFSEARQVSFMGRKSLAGLPAAGKTGVCVSGKKFREWLFGWDPFFADFKPSSTLMEILDMLAYEIFATIMDCAFIVKQECHAAGFGGVQKAENFGDIDSGFTLSTAAASSQQTALLLSQKLRSKPQNRDVQFGLDRLVNVAVQPWELREAIRRLRFQQGDSAHKLFDNETSFNGVIF